MIGSLALGSSFLTIFSIIAAGTTTSYTVLSTISVGFS
jgi:hypothetical protein